MVSPVGLMISLLVQIQFRPSWLFALFLRLHVRFLGRTDIERQPELMGSVENDPRDIAFARARSDSGQEMTNGVKALGAIRRRLCSSLRLLLRPIVDHCADRKSTRLNSSHMSISY